MNKKRRFKTIIMRWSLALLAFLIAFTQVPMYPPLTSVIGGGVVHADPGTYTKADKPVFERGKGTNILWDYDFEHPTIITASGEGGTYTIANGTFPAGDNSVHWAGDVPEGSYTVTVTPDDEFAKYATSTTVFVVERPKAPTLTLHPKLSGNPFSISGMKRTTPYWLQIR